MQESEKLKFSPFKILFESIVFVWWYRFNYLKCLSIPTLILAGTWAIYIAFQSDSYLSNSAFFLLHQIGFVIFSVACHRLVLLGESDYEISSIVSKRVGFFLLWSFFAAIGSLIITGIVLTLVFNMPEVPIPGKESILFYWVQVIATVFAFYVVGRFVLVFPATAVDVRIGLRQSWRQTKGLGWRIVLVIGLYPWIISIFIWLVSPDEPNLFSHVFNTLLYYFGLAFEITALSFIYKSLVPTTESNANDS